MIDELWGYRCRGAPRAPHASAHRCCCARRLVVISEMRGEDRRQPLTDRAVMYIMEYVVYGEFTYKESDVNSTFRAWWVPLRRMVKELG